MINYLKRIPLFSTSLVFQSILHVAIFDELFIRWIKEWDAAVTNARKKDSWTSEIRES